MKESIRKEVKKQVKGQARKKIQKDKAEIDAKTGAEICDPQPIYHDVGFKEPPSINDKIRQITMEVQAATLAKLEAAKMTDEEIKAVLDEENNFDIPDSFDEKLTSYELAGVVSDLEEEVFLTEETTTQPPPAEQSGEPAVSDTPAE